MSDKQILYIVGNGFDLYHKLPTTYQAFAFYLQKNQEYLHRLLHQYIGLPWLDESDQKDHSNLEWSHFERNLAGLDIENVLDDNIDLTANPSLEEFRSGDWHNYEYGMQSIVELLISSLNIQFRSFINSVYIPRVPEVQLLALDRSARYLCFNYTNTLEKVYKVEQEQIHYIHGKADEEHSEIILGHGSEPSKSKTPKKEPPDHLEPEEIEKWYRNGEDGYEYSRDQAENELKTYFYKSHKPVVDVINRNFEFFQSLLSIGVICVLGHSVSDVDIPYFRKLHEELKDNVEWIVTYYSNEGKKTTYNNLLSFGIKEKNISMVKMDFFWPKQPTLFDR